MNESPFTDMTDAELVDFGNSMRRSGLPLLTNYEAALVERLARALQRVQALRNELAESATHG